MDTQQSNCPTLSRADSRRFSNLVQIINRRSELHPDRTAFTFLRNGKEEASLSYLELDRKSRAIANLLQSRTPVPERALLLYDSGEEFITAFLGCFYAGVVAVPTY